MTTAERKEYLKRMRGISREDLVETNLMSDSSEVDSVEKLLQKAVSNNNYSYA